MHVSTAVTVVLLSSWSRLAEMALMENGIVGQPVVTCGNNLISVAFNTKAAFAGSVYAKGFYSKEECRVRGSNTLSSVKMEVPVNFECGMRRKRVVSPNRGLVLEAVVVIMFHPLFLTRIDRSFRVQCMYMEADRLFTQRLDVHTLPPTDLPGPVNDVKMPVLKGGPTGSGIKYASIGEAVYHKWSCQGAQPGIYCMTVHSCTADDGQGMGQQLLDANGCTQDHFLLNNLNYLDDMSAGQEAQVFKFADRQTIFFGCQIRLELKEELGGNCQRNPCLGSDDTGNSHPVESPHRQPESSSRLPQSQSSTGTSNSKSYYRSTTSDPSTVESTTSTEDGNSYGGIESSADYDQPEDTRSSTRPPQKRPRGPGIASVTPILSGPYVEVTPPSIPNRKEISLNFKRTKSYTTTASYGENEEVEVEVNGNIVEERGGYRHRRRRSTANDGQARKEKESKKRFQVDMDVMGSVEVLDSVPTEAQESDSLSLDSGFDGATREKVCLPKSLFYVLTLLTIIVFLLATIFLCLVQRRRAHGLLQKHSNINAFIQSKQVE